MSMSVRFSVDIGGTFTDLLTINDETGEVTSAKVPSTPRDFTKGVLAAIGKNKLDLSKPWIFVHGTTAGLNAFIEKKGAKTGLITTEGFRDVLEITRAGRPNI